jgi:hypothetical protein
LGRIFLHPPLHWRFHFFVASVPVRDLLNRAKYLIVAATFTVVTRLDRLAGAAPICTYVTGGIGVQTPVCRFVGDAGSVSVRQTFVFCGQDAMAHNGGSDI